MADVHDKATRSKNMRAIATRDTAIEKRLASLLTGRAWRFAFRTPVCPDARILSLMNIAARDLPTAASGIIITAICLKCLRLEPKSGRKEQGKNVERDRRDISRLQELGWRVLIVWECALRGREKLTDRRLTWKRLEVVYLR